MPTLLATYLQECTEHSHAVDPSVAAAFATGWDEVVISPHLANPGCLLPLLKPLSSPEGKVIKVLRLVPDSVCGARRAQSRAGDVDARVLRRLLEHKGLCLEELDLRGCYFHLKGNRELAQGVRNSKTLRTLNLGGNRLGSSADIEQLRIAVERSTTLSNLDVSGNWLGFSDIKELEQALRTGWTEEKAQVTFIGHGNAWFYEVLNSVTHGLGAFLSIVGAIVLLNQTGSDATKFWASLIYSISLVGLFTASTLCHALFMLPTTVMVFTILDHSAIYLLIAGSYTPFALISLQDYSSPLLFGYGGAAVAIALWSLAIFGITFGVACSYAKVNRTVQSVGELSLFVFMGFTAIFVWDGFKSALPEAGIDLLVKGGVFYTTGIVFFLAEKFQPACHIIWHIFVMIGATLHFFCILYYVVGFNPTTEPSAFHGAFMDLEVMREVVTVIMRQREQFAELFLGPSEQCNPGVLSDA